MQFPHRRQTMDVGEERLDPRVIATAEPSQGGAYQGQLPDMGQLLPQSAPPSPAPFAGEGYERLTGGLGQPQAQPTTAPTMPNIAPVNDGTIQGTVSNEQISPYEAAKQRYNEKLQVQPKYAAWKEALFLGLQGMAKVFDQNPTPPIRMLKDVRKDYNDQRATAEFAPIAQQYERDQVNAERVNRQKDRDADNERQKRIADSQIADRAYKQTISTRTKDLDEARFKAWWELETRKQTAKEAGMVREAEEFDRKQTEIERNNKARVESTNENTDRRINATSGVKGHSTAPPRTPTTGKTTESAARAYLGKKLKGDALENAIKTARANGEIQ
mgnify:CR=1 FL=1